MRCFSVVLAALLAICLAACSEPDVTAIGSPVTIQTPASGDIAGPRFSTGPDGDLVLSWMEQNGTGTTLRYARLEDHEFTQARDVVTDSKMFVNWADLPSVMPLGGDHAIAHWLRYSADKTYSYDVVVSQSFDGGANWSDEIAAHTDGTSSEHGFVSMAPQDDGVTLLWLDGRHTPEQSMTLRSATITRDGRRVREQEVDDSVCDCCQTDVAMSANGPVAAYRDRTADEVRDIYVTRLIDGQWSEGIRIHADNWTIAGCPVNGPSIVADGNKVTVTWFSAADNHPVVRMATSNDAGKTFSTPVEIASGRVNGYVGLATLDDGAVAVSWVGKTENGDNLVMVRYRSASGALEPPVEVGRTSQLRVFPQLAYSEGDLYLVWTDEAEGSRQMDAVRIPVRVSTHNQSS